MAKIKTRKRMTSKEKFEGYFSDFKEADMIQVDHMMTQSEYTCEEVASYIKNELNYFICEGSIRTIQDKLYGYNKHILKPKVLGEIDDIDVYKELLSLKGKVDVMRELTVLILHQKERLRRILAAETRVASKEKEGDMGKAHKDLAAQARREIKELRELLEKLATIQMKTGVLKVAPKLISGEFIKDDEKDISRLKFVLREDFMENLDAIEGEFSDLDLDLKELGIDVKEIESDG